MTVTPNKRIRLTKRGHALRGPASRAVVDESRFAAYPRG